MAVGGPLVRRFFWGPRAGVGIRGRTQRTSGFGVAPKAAQTQTQAVDFSKVGVDEAHAPTEVSALPACIWM